MGSLRDAAIPLEHIAAELAAIPLSSPRAFELAPTSFNPECKGVTEKLWRAAERELVTAFPSFSIDEFVALRDWLWFRNEIQIGSQDEEKEVSLVEYVYRLSEATLEFAGNVYKPRLPIWAEQTTYDTGGAPDARARRFWRWISFALPPDLLIAARGDTNAVTAEIELVSPVLSRMLADGGFTEPHVHVGAGISFDMLWVAVHHALAQADALEAKDFYSPGAEGNEGYDFIHLLLHGAVCRYTLAAFLQERERHPALTFLTEFLQHFVEPLLSNRLPPDRPDEDEHWPTWNATSQMADRGDREAIEQLNRAYRSRIGVHGSPESWRMLTVMLHNLAKGAVTGGERGIDVDLRSAQHVYARLTRIRERWPKFPATPLEGLRADPIGDIFPAQGRDLETSEIGFIRASLRYLRGAGAKDDVFAKLFWQTQRVKTQFYRHVVQRPMTPGLQWFVRFYRRLRAGRGSGVGVGLLVYESARISGMGQGLKGLELRTSPAETPEDTKSLVDSFREAFEALQRVDRGVIGGAGTSDEDSSHRERNAIERAQRVAPWTDARSDSRRTEFGLVLHFTRERGGGWDQGRPTALGRGSHADPQAKDNLGLRFSAFYRTKRREAHSVATMLHRYPRSLQVLRGIDVCTDELGVPTWVLAPLCNYVRSVSRATSDYLRRECGENVPPLRVTVHAGEEFIHLLGGLRRVDEALSYLELGQGDRIGHAMSLGVHPGDWCRRSGAVAVSKLERLLDLAWEWRFATTNGIALSANRLQFVIDQIERLSRDIFKEFAHPPQVARFLELLGDSRYLGCVAFPNGPVPEYEEFLSAARALDAKLGSSHVQVHHDIEKVWRDLSQGASRAEEDWKRDIASALLSLYQRIESPHSAHGEEPLRLLYRYLTDARAFREGQVLTLVDPIAEEQSIFDLQVALRKKVGAKGITVEINPSSNLLIGNLSDLKNHPLWRLKPPQRDEALGDIALCIGTDDPITFMSGTRQEYQLIYDTLTLAGLSDNGAREWIDDCRRAGLESRFTVGAGADFSHDKIWELMDVDLSHLQQLR